MALKQILLWLILLFMTIGFGDTAYAEQCNIPDWADPNEMDYDYFIGVTGPARYTMRFDFNVESAADPNNLDQWDIEITTDSEFVEVIDKGNGDYAMEIWVDYPGIYYFNIYASVEETEWSEAAEVKHSGALRIRKHKPQLRFGCREYEFSEDGSYEQVQ